MWAWNVVIWIDQGVNAVFGPMLNVVFGVKRHKFGNPDETLSSVFGKNIESGECKACRLICKVLNLFDRGHCESSIERDEVAK